MEDPKPRRVRRLGVVLFCFAVVLTGLGAFHLIENRRGKQKWEAYKRELTAQGIKLDLASFIPPTIPPEQNFAATPFFDSLLPGPRPTNWNRWPNLIKDVWPQIPGRKLNERRLTDVVAWQTALRAHNRQETNGITGTREDAAREVLEA